MFFLLFLTFSFIENIDFIDRQTVKTVNIASWVLAWMFFENVTFLRGKKTDYQHYIK